MKKYYVDDEEVDEKEFMSKLEDSCMTQAEDTFDEMLDDCYDEVVIGSIRLQPSDVLKECACGDYKIMRGDYATALQEDAEYDLETIGWYYGYSYYFKIIEEEE